jgi:hypothetical protein
MKRTLSLLTVLLFSPLAFAVDAGDPFAKVGDRKWRAIPAIKRGDTYEAPIPAEAAQWFILVSDDRPMSVSSDMMTFKSK